MLAALRTARLVGDGPVGRLSLHDFRREGVGDLDRLMPHRVQPAIPLRLVDLARFLAQLPGHRRNPSSQLAANRHPWLLIFASFLPERPARPQIASLAFTQIQPPRKPQAAPQRPDASDSDLTAPARVASLRPHSVSPAAACYHSTVSSDHLISLICRLTKAVLRHEPGPQTHGGGVDAGRAERLFGLSRRGQQLAVL